MSLMVLMYHRAREGRFGNSPEMLEAHFAHIASHYACVMPGERLDEGRLNVCLSFDDAYADFYSEVFPRLIRYNLRSVLAVSAGLIAPCLVPPPGQVLSGPFCSWNQLREMSRSGAVDIAAHGYLHGKMDEEGTDLEREVDLPQSVLTEAIDRPVSTIVFPYGRFSSRALARAKGRYSHFFRIGGAQNEDWTGLTYRISADEMTSPTSVFSCSRRLAYRAKYHWNRLRGR